MSMDRDRNDEGPPRVASGYALGRLLRALETATNHADDETRRRAEQKALAWEAVLDGMASGRLEVGSRTPVADTPAWVTLEVVTGGFATGRYVAEAPVDEAELALFRSISSADPEAIDRFRLNTWFLSDDGQQLLVDALQSGRYAIDVPEHGALLVVTWLLEHGHDELALDLAAELFPLMSRLRFAPPLLERPATSGALVRISTVGDVTRQLSGLAVPRQVEAMNEALTVWAPLYDRLVALWNDTVEDGWPCRRWQSDWTERRAVWISDYDRANAAHTRCRDHRRPNSNFSVLRAALARCEHDSSALNGRDVGRIRLALQRSIERWGAPGSSERTQLRAKQQEWAATPTRQEIAGAVVERLSPFPPADGISDVVSVLVPVELDDRPPIPVPNGMSRKVERALEAPVEELIDREIIGSAEVLAQVLPQISSHVAAGTFDDPTLRELYSRIYSAFRRRRSLLLLNLEHQVQIEELPWVGALTDFKSRTVASRTAALDTLRQTTLLTLTAFPQTIVPNPLVRELGALAKDAEVEVPLVEEVASDIFMGTFTMKWREAARVAAQALEGTLYARYYDLPSPQTWAPIDNDPGTLARLRSRFSKPTAEDFAQVCNDRAREAALGDGNFVARSGTVIEQSQVLTTHNLAPLVGVLGLADRLRPSAQWLAIRNFGWIVRQQNIRYGSLHAQLQMLKNTAYAWRQAIYFLSLVEVGEQQTAIEQLRASAASQPDEWRLRFTPVIGGLAAVVEGQSFDELGHTADGRRFLGWTVGRHWLLPTV